MPEKVPPLKEMGHLPRETCHTVPIAYPTFCGFLFCPVGVVAWTQIHSTDVQKDPL